MPAAAAAAASAVATNAAAAPPPLLLLLLLLPVLDRAAAPPLLPFPADAVGAGLSFCGLRGEVSSDERRFSYRHKHVLGRAIMHLGHHRHGADDIITGERYNLIMWNKSSTYRASRAFMSKYQTPPDSRGPPDLVCLSYTHDKDYEDYKEYPPGKRPKPNQGG